ncbi:MAG TPA: serine hydrolase domain-containing protein [Anaerolineales bacterium]|nr:serine hydrolase domain-containing protein [Anaerolineales bacterium]
MRKISMLLIIPLLAGILLVPPTPAMAYRSPPMIGLEGGGPTDVDALEAFLDGLVNYQLSSQHIAGAVVAVVLDGEILLTKGYGYADVEHEVPVSPTTSLFRPGSISKLFIWTAVMQLVECGQLDLNTDINTYLANASPSFTIPDTFPQPITLAHLMTHTPGFEDQGMGIMARSADEILPLGEYLATHMPQRVRPPGELSAYSNYGSVLAGYIVELVSGIPYEQYIEENIFKPLQMTHSTFAQPLPEGLSANTVLGYQYANGIFEAQDFEYIQASPAGALSASAVDMAHFMLAHLQGGQYQGAQILQPETVTQMHTRQFAHDPAVSGWGYGFYETLAGELRGIGHGGDTQLFHSELLLLPEQQMGVFVSYNSAEASLAATEFLTAFINHYFQPEQSLLPEPSAAAPQTYQRYLGAYMGARNNFSTPEKITALFTQVNVSLTPQGRLLVHLAFPGQMPAQFVEVSPLTFAPVDPASALFGRMVFREDEQGNITHLFFENFPTSAYVRLPWYAGTNFNLAVLALCMVLFSTVIALGPAVAWINRRLDIQHSRAEILARRLAWVICLLNMIFLPTLFLVLSSPEIMFGDTSAVKLLLLLPWLLAALTAALVVFVILAWSGVWNPGRKPYWNLLGRLHFTLLAFAALFFVWWMAYWGILA